MSLSTTQSLTDRLIDVLYSSPKISSQEHIDKTVTILSQFTILDLKNRGIDDLLIITHLLYCISSNNTITKLDLSDNNINDSLFIMFFTL